MGSRKKITAGYRYYMRLEMGFCRGPVDALVQINVGDRLAFGEGAPAWEAGTFAKVSKITQTQSVSIVKPDLFGGEKGEGGVYGEFFFNNGDTAGSYGVVTALYDGIVSMNSPYPKRWTARLRRILKGWDGAAWYPQKAKIELLGGQIHAMNPAHILLECQTNRDWGRGKHRSLLDLASFEKAADRLHQEGFGLCLKWRRSDDMSRFEEAVLDHIGGALYLSRTSGLWVLKLIRDDYDKNDLPLFKDGTGLLAVEECQITGQDGSANQTVVGWVDPRDGKTRHARAKNLGAIQAAGGVLTTQVDYPGLPTAELALRVAARDCFASTAQIASVKIKLDRRAFKLEPASVFRLHAPEYGITDTVFRVGAIDYGTRLDGAIKVQAVEDIFTLPETGTSASQTPPPAISVVQPITAARLFEPSFFDCKVHLNNEQQSALTPDSAPFGALAARPLGVPIGFDLYTRAGYGSFTLAESGDFCPTAKTAAAIPQSDAPITLAITDGDSIDLSLISLASAVLINNEILRLDAVDIAASTITVTRGCADTVPAAHAAGSLIWFYQDALTLDPKEYLTGQYVQGKCTTRTNSGNSELATATIESLTLTARHEKPYPPGQLRINGAAYPAQITGELSVSWAHRNRLLQADQLIGSEQGSVTSEANVTYSLRIKGESGALLKQASGLNATTYSYAEADELADSNLTDNDGNPRLNNLLTIELWSVRDGTESAQKHQITVSR